MPCHHEKNTNLGFCVFDVFSTASCKVLKRKCFDFKLWMFEFYCHFSSAGHKRNLQPLKFLTRSIFSKTEIWSNMLLHWMFGVSSNFINLTAMSVHQIYTPTWLPDTKPCYDCATKWNLAPTFPSCVFFDPLFSLWNEKQWISPG